MRCLPPCSCIPSPPNSLSIASAPCLIISFHLVLLPASPLLVPSPAPISPSPVPPLSVEREGKITEKNTIFCSQQTSTDTAPVPWPPRPPAIFSDLLCALNFILFVVVVIIVVIATAIVYLFFPDTLDVDLNETEFLFKGHWFWRHFYPEAERIEVLHRLGCPCCCGAQEEGPSQEHLAISGSIQDVPDVSFSLGDTHNPLPTLTDVYGVPCSVREGGFATSSRTTVPNISQSNIMSILGQSTSRNTHLPVSSTSSRTSHPSSIKE